MISKTAKIASGLLVICFAILVQSKPWEPEPRAEQWWLDRHEQYVNNSRINGANISIVFTGSSSIDNWRTTGKEIWDAKYAPLGAVNYGIGGDSIQHLLWRITNGEMDNMSPKMVVVYCGANNVPGNPSNDEIIRGINETLAELASRLPETKILYLNINPRGDVNPVNGTWERIKAINEQITLQLDAAEEFVIFDMFDDFVESWGQIKSEFYQTDKLHFNKDGYTVWDSVWNETFYSTLN